MYAINGVVLLPFGPILARLPNMIDYLSVPLPSTVPSQLTHYCMSSEFDTLSKYFFDETSESEVSRSVITSFYLERQDDVVYTG